MSNTTHLTVKPIDVTCPVCKAAVTEHCVSETGRKAKTHSARRREAEQAELDLNDPTKAVHVEVIQHDFTPELNTPEGQQARAESELEGRMEAEQQEAEELAAALAEVHPSIVIVPDEQVTAEEAGRFGANVAVRRGRASEALDSFVKLAEGPVNRTARVDQKRKIARLRMELGLDALDFDGNREQAVAEIARLGAELDKANAEKKAQEPAPEPAPGPAATEVPDGAPGTVKDAYSKERKAVKLADGTVSIFTESRNRWFVTKDLRVAASFKPQDA